MTEHTMVNRDVNKLHAAKAGGISRPSNLITRGLALLQYARTELYLSV
jgi:hypothetical protein